MARQPKESEMLHCKIDKKVADELTEFCKKSGLTKTASVERALKMYFENYNQTGKA